MASNASLLRRRKANVPNSPSSGDTSTPDESAAIPFISIGLADLALALSLVFGGCCTNVWAFEKLLQFSPRVGSALTFIQMLFITVVNLPFFIDWTYISSPSKYSRNIFRLMKPRQVPLSQWALQVILLTSGSLMNNWAFAYDIPLPLQIVFRSSGLPVSMVLGYVVLKKTYSVLQIAAVLMVTCGVLVATLSRPSSSAQSNRPSDTYYFGVLLLTISLLLTGILGVLQETTYKRYGPWWREGILYTHMLSLPLFLFIAADIKYGNSVLLASAKGSLGIPIAMNVLLVNLVTQLLCVSGVNQLTSKVSSVSTNLVLTARKAVSLCLSVMLLGSPWNAGLVTGASLVFVGSLIYTFFAVK